MSIFKNITRIFLRKRATSGSEMVVDKEDSPTEKNLPGDAGHTFFFSSYQHGFTNGVLQIKPDEDSFFRFLKHEREIERLEELRHTKTIELEKLRTELAAQRSIELEKKKVLAVNKVQEDHLVSRLNQLKEQKEKMTTKRDLLNALRDKVKPEYPWVPALFFFLAGVGFIVADISITHDITANGFNMDDEEGWIFAIGLAFTAFLIKPLIDRFFEKPFQQSGHILKKAYLGFLTLIVAGSIIMLFLLGSFRADAKGVLSKIESNDGYIEAINSNPVIDTRSRDSLYKANDVLLGDLGEKQNGQAGLILSGILFAIGGGMCLSVAFPSLTALMNRYVFHSRQIKRLDMKISALQIHEEKTLDCLAQRLEAIKVALLEIELIGADALKTQVDSHYAQLSEITDHLYGERALRDQMLYLDGKERGSMYSLEGELKYTLNYSTSDLKNETDNPDGASKRKYTRRPYIKLRKLLADTYNKSKNGTFYEDSEIDIPE